MIVETNNFVSGETKTCHIQLVWRHTQLWPFDLSIASPSAPSHSSDLLCWVKIEFYFLTSMCIPVVDRWVGGSVVCFVGELYMTYGPPTSPPWIETRIHHYLAIFLSVSLQAITRSQTKTVILLWLVFQYGPDSKYKWQMRILFGYKGSLSTWRDNMQACW